MDQLEVEAQFYIQFSCTSNLDIIMTKDLVNVICIVNFLTNFIE